MFKCEKCTSVFTRKDSLTRHEDKYNNVRYSCTECVKTFTQKSNIKRHMKIVHGVQHVRADIEIAPQVFVPNVPAGPSNQLSHWKNNTDEMDMVQAVNNIEKDATTSENMWENDIDEMDMVQAVNNFENDSTTSENIWENDIDEMDMVQVVNNFEQDEDKSIKTKSMGMNATTPGFKEAASVFKGFKELNEIDAFHSSESKSSHSLTNIENINSINPDSVSKNMENIELTVTAFDDGIKRSNVNDTIEFQAVKPVSLIDHQTNSKERHLKDMSVTINRTNIIKNIKKKKIVKMKYDNLQQTKPLQLIWCKLCSIYVVQQNYKQHEETTVHQISFIYFNNKKIQINRIQSEDCFLSCRILSPKYDKYDSIDRFFQSIESDVVELFARIIQLQNNGPINVNIKMFGLYNQNILVKKLDTLGDVKSFMIKNEILCGVTNLLDWIQKILNKFKFHNQQYLKSMPQSYYLECIMFLEIYFYI